MNSRISQFLALAAIACVALTSPAAVAQDKENRTIHAAYLTSLSFSPLFRAIEAGYFEDEKIDLKLEIVRSSSDTMALLGRGQLDAAFGNIGDSFFNAIERGVDVRIAGGMSYYPEDKNTLSSAPVLVRKDLIESGEIKTLADLKGRKIAFNTRGGVIEYLVAQALKKVDMTVDDIDIVQISFPDMLVALSNGAVDAVVLPEPLATLSQQRDLAKVLEPNPSPGTMATSLLFGQSLLTDEKADLAKGFLRALRRAAADLQSPEQIMSEENLAIWHKHTKVPAKVIAATAPYVFDKELSVDVDSLMDQQQYLVDSKQISGRIEADKLIADEFAKRK